MSGWVFFLGNARYGEFESLRGYGLRVGLLRDVTSHGWRAADDAFDAVLPWDPRADVAALVAALTPYLGELAGVLNLREAYVEPYARLCAATGVPALSAERVGELRSKDLMRSLFAARIGPDSTGAHAAVDSAQQVVAFGDRYGWPVVVKPAGLYSSLYVTTVHDAAGAPAAFAAVRDGVRRHVAAKGLPPRFEALQVEQFLAGSNHSVDLAVARDGTPYPSPVVDVLTGHDLGGHDFHHFARFAPSRAPQEAQERMRDLAVAAVRALDLHTCAAHVEFILTAAGPRLLEVGVRPGGHRLRMLSEGYGVDFAHGYLAAVRGRRPELAARRHTPFAIVTPFPARTGVFAGLHGMDRVTGLASYRSHAVYSPPGAAVGAATDGHWQIVSIELASSSMAALADDVARIWRMRDLVATRAADDDAARPSAVPTPAGT